MKHYDPRFDETYYTETMENGLKVVLFHRPDFVETCCALGTPFGAYHLYESLNGRDIDTKPGTAHFLEHKLFETEEKDIMAFFSSLGANVNAFTSYEETVYYFTYSGKDIRQCLGLLLDFVFDLNITKESVEKEKGIITQEIAMYEEVPDTRLLNETMRVLYEKIPLRYDVGGSKESVYSITKEDLEEAYRLHYHPSRMILCISTPSDPEEVLNFLRKHPGCMGQDSEEELRMRPVEEGADPLKKEHSFQMDIHKSKHVFAFKIKPVFRDDRDALFKEWCVRLYMEAHFSMTNPLYQTWLDKGWINDYFGYEVEFEKDYAHILVYFEGEDPDLLWEIQKEIAGQDLLDEKTLQRLKRRYLGSAYESLDDPESFTLGYIRDALGGVDFFDGILVLESITVEDVKRVVHSFDYSHHALISVRRK
ncbi:MAG: insulinase family protein [Erysipelotrichaceae bacterium]|nr:insulinase family protein [Erysipelotrichaceae bacterium]